jgi:glycosyltransferase involved in cell wall biosynthesis
MIHGSGSGSYNRIKKIMALKILLIYYEPRISGQTTHVLSLARFLDKHRYQLTVVLPDHLQQCQKVFLQTGATVVMLPLRKLVWPTSSVIKVMRLISQGRMDVVHIHSQEMGLTARPLSWLVGARNIIYTPQTIDIRQIRWYRLYILIERALAHITKVIISVNQVDRSRMEGWGIPSRKIRVIPNGIDAVEVHQRLDRLPFRSMFGLDEKKPLVMQVGRLSAQKNPLGFIAGADLVLRRIPETQFVLVGEGPLEQEVLDQIHAQKLEKKVRMLGWQPEAARLMAEADVVTLTSLWEGTPYSLLEAMASCKPVVTTSVNGCMEIVEDGVTGFSVPVNNPAAWAERVIALVSDPALSTTMGQRGRQRVQENYSVQKMVQQLDVLYSEMASE